MSQSRMNAARKSVGANASKLVGAILKGLTRMVETLGPQPQLQPVPVRADGRRLPRR